MSYPAAWAGVSARARFFTAGAITQEKDSQTYDILLATPLTNGQIVLGSMLSRLFFVVALLLSGIPVFSITQVFGGDRDQICDQSWSVHNRGGDDGLVTKRGLRRRHDRDAEGRHTADDLQASTCSS